MSASECTFMPQVSQICEFLMLSQTASLEMCEYHNRGETIFSPSNQQMKEDI